MLTVNETMERYKVDQPLAQQMLDMVENMFDMDWSEMSWGQIDRRMKKAKEEVTRA